MQHFVVHPENPQRRLIKKAVELLQKDVIAYPTDSYYAFGCLQRNTEAIDKIRRLRQIDASHLFTLSCRDIRQVGDYAVINNAAFRLLRQHAPGAYTFILTATKKAPKRLHHPRRKNGRLPRAPAFNGGDATGRSRRTDYHDNTKICQRKRTDRL